MALSIYFRPKSMNTNQYDDVIKRLEKAGAGNPKGRLYHACFGSNGNLHVHDVWDTKENFDMFGQTLMPILKKVNVDPGEPEVKEIHNIIEG